MFLQHFISIHFPNNKVDLNFLQLFSNLNVMMKFLEIKTKNSKFNRKQKTKRTGCADSTFKRYRIDNNMNIPFNRNTK